jgi:hypothetical protein
MPIDSGLNGLMSVLPLSEPVKTTVSAGVPTLEDLEDVFLDLADDESKVLAMLEHILDESIVTHHDIHCIMFVFQWFMLNIVDPCLNGPTSLTLFMWPTSKQLDSPSRYLPA